MMQTPRRFVLSCLLVLASLLAPVGSQAATNCGNPNRDGKTIGKIVVGKVAVDVKSVTYPAGGELAPPRSPLNAGVSARHNPLSADFGSSVIVWHINYDGCIGKLDVINKKPVGYTFRVTDEKGQTVKYAISAKYVVPKGKYKPEWFLLSGPRQLTMITCTGKVVNRHYVDNLVIIATPVAPAVSTSPSSAPSPSPSPSN